MPFIMKEKTFKDDPFLRISSPKYTSPLPNVLFDEQVQLLFKYNRERTDTLRDRDQALLEIMYATGMRASEVVTLTLQQINFSERTINVIGKGNKERLVAYTRECATTLKQYLDKTRPNLLGKRKNPSPNQYCIS